MKKNILVVPSDSHGVGFFRSLNPHIALESKYPDCHIDIDMNPNLNDDELLKSYDIIHYHRTLGPYEEMPELLEKLDNMGVKTIMDIDDHWDPGKHHPAYNVIKRVGLDKKILNNIKIARNITTTTHIFAELIRKYNKNVFVIPNAINPNEEQYKPKKTKSNRLRIGWLGGSSHLEDLKLLKGLVTMLKGAKLLDKVQFVLCGFDLSGKKSFRDSDGQIKERNIRPQESVWYQYEKIFTDDYKIISDYNYKNYLNQFTNSEYEDIDNQPYRRVWTKPINSYATSYNLFDVSLAPLQDNKFNSCKSQLKVIEAAFHNKVIIAQDFGPYQLDLVNMIKKGSEMELNEYGNAFLIKKGKSAKDWFKIIKKLINNPDLITESKKRLHNDITTKYSLDEVSKVRNDIYNNILK